MTSTIVLLSGSVASGKSTVAAVLLNQHGFRRVSSSEYLRQVAAGKGLPPERTVLQELGDQLDLDTDFSWIVSEVAAPILANSPDQKLWLVDAVRKRRQVEHFRDRFGSALHIHIWAPELTLKERYITRLIKSGVNETAAVGEYDRAVRHPNEVEARSLAAMADLQFDTSSMSPEEIAAAISH